LLLDVIFFPVFSDVISLTCLLPMMPAYNSLFKAWIQF
jgi:hypothetical protein